ncbi:MAG: HNH endonuclease [Desulfobacteraceae bacterium]|nr:HNH endonuclease [Desulfobacteraceae bacterium]
MKMFDRLPYGSTTKERLEAYSIPEPNSGCWLWLAYCDRGGYGKIAIDGKSTLAHRVCYEEFIGVVPDGVLVLHRCDTPPCINPGHLFLGTHLDNTRDRISKGRRIHPEGENMGNAKLSKDAVLSVVDLLKHSELTHADIGSSFGVASNTICVINTGENWSHLTGLSRENPARASRRTS